MKRTMMAKLGAALFGILLAVLVAEVGLRIAYSALPMGLQIALRDVRVTPWSDQRMAPAPIWQPDRDYQMITVPEVVDQPQAGAPTIIFPVTTYRWWGGRVGFRSPPPTDGSIPIVALGDSHTFCFTPIQACWVTQLAETLKTPISNLGQPASGSVSHAALYRDFISKPALGLQQPRLVLWQFYGNDYNDDYGLALLNGQATTPAPPESLPPTMKPWQQWWFDHSMLYAMLYSLIVPNPGVQGFVDPYRAQRGEVTLQFGRSYLQSAFDMMAPRNQEGEQLSHHAILSTRDTVQRNGGQFVIILMPTKEEVYQVLTAPVMGQAALDLLATPRQRLLAWCATEQLTCFDLLPVLQAHAGEQLFFPSDIHLNAAGNQLVADAVAAFLREHHLVEQ